MLLDERERTPFELDEIDIETSDELVREYGLRIPVVVIDGRGGLRVRRSTPRSSPALVLTVDRGRRPLVSL